MSMPFVGWREFLPLIQLKVPKCPVPVIVQAVRGAARKFCTRTRLWTHRSEATDILAGHADYACAVQDRNAETCAVLKVEIRGQPLESVNAEQWRGLDPTHSAELPGKYMVTEPGIVHLWPIPSQDMPGAMTVEVALTPTLTSDKAPSFLLSAHDRTIAAEALKDLMLIPNQPWTDLQIGMAHGQDFIRQENRARIAASRGGTNARFRGGKMGI